ncbi:UNVERIFIED_CONTAM: hypothetical protein Sangu_2638200 [Sesamum angustifolium]|uniref:DUF4057 domain-containing protein n=1 Tax=Sesamum angustifolium TaxID=2727405 RepID=A0AAW2J549_9LAMI
MEKSTPVRKPHTSTADLLTWSENPPEYSPAPASSARSHQPSDGISKVVFGGQVTDEEVESLNKSFSKKPSTVPEVAKQRELSGNMESESEAKLKKQISDAKNKELSGHNIFAPPPEIQPRPLTARALALRESITIGESASSDGAGGQRNGASSEEPVIKTSKKIPNQKFTELSGNDIFKGDAPPTSAEKPLSSAKLREMSGSNIFADGKKESRDYFGGVRKPPVEKAALPWFNLLGLTSIVHSSIAPSSLSYLVGLLLVRFDICRGVCYVLGVINMF